MPNEKKKITANVVPFPSPKNEPTNINRKIIVDDKILKWIPIIDPIIKKKIMNKVLPRPIPKCDPTKAIYSEEYKIDKLVEEVLSKNLTLNK